MRRETKIMPLNFFSLLFFLLFLTAVEATNKVEKSKAKLGNSSGASQYINVDQSSFADYGVKLNEFQVSPDAKVTYPALFDSLAYAAENKLDPCEDFYEYVCRGVKNTVDAGAAKSGLPLREQGSLVHNQIIVHQIEQFWLAHFTKSELQAKLPKTRATQDMLTFFNKCVSHGEEVDEFKDLLVNQFKFGYLADGSQPPELLEMSTELLLRTHPFNPFFTIRRIATKEFSSGKTSSSPMESREFRLEFLFFVMDNDTLLGYQTDLEPKGIRCRKRGLSAEDEKKVQATLLQITDEIFAFVADEDNDCASADACVLKTTLADYQKSTFGLDGKLDWVKLMRGLFPDANATGSDTLLMRYPNTFKKYAQVLLKYGQSKSEIDRLAMSEYIFWNVIFAVKSVSSYQMDTFTPLNCVKGMMYLYGYFADPMSQFFAQSMGVHNEKDVVGIYDFARTGFKQMLQESNWLNESRKTYAIKKIDHILMSIDRQSELPEKQTTIAKVYNEYQLNSSLNWLQTLFQVHRSWHRNMPFRKFFYTDLCEDYDFTKQITIGQANILLPVYNPKFPAAYNFGYFGSVLGHEQSHALQPWNKQYDIVEPGYGPNYWASDFTEEYKKRANCYKDQYEKEFKRLYPNFTKAETLDEDMADEVGLRVGFRAWKHFQQQQQIHPESAQQTFAAPLDKLTQEQIFFMGHAFTWCFSDRDDPLRNPPTAADAKDLHSSARMRTNLPLMNFAEFSKAFQCKPGQRMNPPDADRCYLYDDPREGGKVKGGKRGLGQSMEATDGKTKRLRKS